MVSVLKSLPKKYWFFIRYWKPDTRAFSKSCSTAPALAKSQRSLLSLSSASCRFSLTVFKSTTLTFNFLLISSGISFTIAFLPALSLSLINMISQSNLRNIAICSSLKDVPIVATMLRMFILFPPATSINPSTT